MIEENSKRKKRHGYGWHAVTQHKCLHADKAAMLMEANRYIDCNNDNQQEKKP